MSQLIKLSLVLSVGGLLIAVLMFDARAAYIEPGATASDGAIAPPLNSSDSIQRKTGTLIIGDGDIEDKLCLNGDDADHCVSSWDEITSDLGGPFVELSNNQILDNPMSPASYSSQSGYARVRAVNQSYSSIFIAAPICINYDPNHLNEPCYWSDEDGLQNCRCAKSGLGCRVNGDCGMSPSAIYASEINLLSSYASIFSGVVQIGLDIRKYDSYLCLNGSEIGVDCIDSWDDITATELTGYVKLQSTISEEQLGGASVSGVGQAASIIAGDPTEISMPSCGGVLCSCGDGLCSDPEQVTNCPVDCETINPVAVLKVNSQHPGINGYAQTSVALASGPQYYLLIARADGSTMPFVPQDGRVYSPGTVLTTTGGSVKILYAGLVNAGGNTFWPVETDFTSGNTYTYAAWEGNLYPRYSAVATVTTEIYKVTFQKTGTYAEHLGILGTNGFNCPYSYYPCLYVETWCHSGYPLTVYQIVSDEYIATWAGACTSYDECTFTISQEIAGEDDVIESTATVEDSGGGGGGGGGGGKVDD